MTLIELTIYAALAEWLILGVILLVGIRRWNKKFGELYDKLLEEWDNEGLHRARGGAERRLGGR